MDLEQFSEEHAVKKVTFSVWKQILKIMLKSKKELVLLIISLCFSPLVKRDTRLMAMQLVI